MHTKGDTKARGEQSSRANVTPLGAIARGFLAGGVGTAAMDLLLFWRYKRFGGEDSLPAWEFSSEITDWEAAPAPAQIGRRLVEGVFQVQLPSERAAVVNNVTHWAYGMFGGVQYAIVAGSLASRRVLWGIPFGATVWTTSYIVLPLAHLYKPIWEYDLPTLAQDLSAHLVYGLTTAVAFELLSR
jgi:hypothetical protein